MSRLDAESTFRIENAIRSAVRQKLAGYEPETDYKPFHTRLLGKDRMQLYSFIHSLITNFGSAIYEPVAEALALRQFENVELQRKLPNELSSTASARIDQLVDALIVGDRDADRSHEDAAIRSAIETGGSHIQTRLPRVDLWLESSDNAITMIEIKTVKPNSGDFERFKRNMLRWYAVGVEHYPGRTIRTALAFPYNPYYPNPYRRWTMKGMLDIGQEVFVAEEFWNYLAGDDIHDELLDCFQRVGIELRPELDDKFADYAKD